jgi:predicted nucleic acid-binding protein
MSRLIFLDSSPLGLLSNARGKPRADRCREWVKALTVIGVRILVPEIADFEVRRKLLHIGASAGIRRLDEVKETLDYVPITTEAMLLAAELWADSRRAGLPTSSPESLDGDCILAAQALWAAGSEGVVMVATDNPDHLGRFLDAQLWETITT